MPPVKENKGTYEIQRGDIPKASISFDKMGRPVNGLGDAPRRGQLARQFEAAKAAFNIAAEEKLLRPQSGRRTAAREALQAEWARRERVTQVRPPREVNDFYLRSSSANPLTEGCSRAVKLAPSTPAQAHSVRVFHEGQLPYSLRTHVTPYMAPMVENPERETRSAQERTRRDKAALEQFASARAFGLRKCEEYPHGLTKLAIAKLRAANTGLVHLADIPSVSFISATVTAT